MKRSVPLAQKTHTYGGGIRNLLFLCGLVALIVSCTKDLEETFLPRQQEVPGLKGGPSEGPVYNEILDCWMIWQADPFRLENIQKAYDKLAREKIDGFIEGTKLKAIT